MRKWLVTGVAAIVLSLFAESNSAQAQFGNSGYGFYGGLNYPFFITERMPFYTRHPPVYYSLPSARTYGQSPFAYPPTYSDERSYRPRRFVSTHALTQPVDQVARNAVRPIVVKNPFVK